MWLGGRALSGKQHTFGMTGKTKNFSFLVFHYMQIPLAGAASRFCAFTKSWKQKELTSKVSLNRSRWWRKSQHCPCEIKKSWHKLIMLTAVAGGPCVFRGGWMACCLLCAWHSWVRDQAPQRRLQNTAVRAVQKGWREGEAEGQGSDPISVSQNLPHFSDLESIIALKTQTCCVKTTPEHSSHCQYHQPLVSPAAHGFCLLSQGVQPQHG